MTCVCGQIIKLLISSDFWLNDSLRICLMTELMITFRKSKTILRREFSFFVAVLYWWKERMCWLTFTKPIKIPRSL